MAAAQQLLTVEQRRAAILASVAALSPDQQQWRADPTTWSALDVIEHLVIAEQLVLGDVRSASTRADAPRRLKHRFRRVLVRLVLGSGLRVKVPAPAMRPTGGLSFDALRAQWDAQHAALRTFVTTADQQLLTRRVFRHPIAGPLNVTEALQLLHAHLGTHQRQLQRLQHARDRSTRP